MRNYAEKLRVEGIEPNVSEHFYFRCECVNIRKYAHISRVIEKKKKKFFW
jgi:hypothetical protein